MYDLLHRLGFSSLMPRPQHKDADEDLQACFREVVVDQIQAIRDDHPDQEVHVYFEDEARMGQQGTLCRVWARTGSRPRAVRQVQYGDLYVLAAVCAGTGHACGLISPTLNVGVINIFLEQFSRELPAGVHAVLIRDGAGYHISPGVVVPSNISLIQLVPYSPELNPVEYLWHSLRSQYWSLRVDANYEAMEEAVMASWRQACLSPKVAQSMHAPPYVDGKMCTVLSGNRIKRRFLKAGLPVISVDAKKKELIGDSKNSGRVWRRQPAAVNAHDLARTPTARVAPYGLYDLTHNQGHVTVGSPADTAEFAVDAIAGWWEEHGSKKFPGASQILILADAGGSNGCRTRLWKLRLQEHLVDRLGLCVTVCHDPSGASKWNPVEHRLFGPISVSWAG